MKKIYPLGNSPFLKNCIILMAVISGIIYSCKKDDRPNQQTPDNAAIAAAKTWYQDTYPVGSNSTSTIRTNSLDTAADLSQIIIPDWQHATTYTQQNKQVIEIPLDPSVKHGFALENNESGTLANSKENSKASFILLKEGNSYQAYLMIIMADSAYIKNDPRKLARNTYQEIDTGFIGHVLYVTPKGKYLKDSVYLSKQASKARKAADIPDCALALQTIHTKKTNSTTLKTQAVTQYIDWYLNTYDNGVLINSEYEYTTTYISSCDPPTGGGGEAGGGGSGGTVSAPDDPVVSDSSRLTLAQKVKIDSVIDKIKQDCLGQAILDYMHDNNKTFRFMVNESFPTPVYNPTNGKITVPSPSMLTDVGLTEEFFHAYQNFHIPGGTSQYANVINASGVITSYTAGGANIEFEARLLRDLNQYMRFGMITTPNIPYYDWIASITNNGTSYPTSFTSTQLDQYNQFLADAVNPQSGDSLSEQIANFNLPPTSMFSVISSSPCSTH
jgi:hypothetical protein